MQPEIQENRKSKRLRVLKGAKIVLGASSLLDCVVLDLTNSGARIKIPNTVNLPDKLALTFDGGHTCRQCWVAWRKLNVAGVEFLDATSQQSAA